MNSRGYAIIVILLFNLANSVAQDGGASVLFLKSGMKEIVSRTARPIEVADGFLTAESPLWHPDGYLLFSDVVANKILKYDPKKGVSTFIENNEVMGPESQGEGQGAKILALDNNGNIILCQFSTRQLIMYRAKYGVIPLARHFRGTRLNGPTDAVVKADGTIFFTDPATGPSHNQNGPADDHGVCGLFRLKNRNLEILDGELKNPQALTLSAGEQLLYVVDLDGGKRYYYRYSLDREGYVREKVQFYTAEDIAAMGEQAGINIDRKGNCYVAGAGGILVINDKGVHLGTIVLPEQPTGLCWGGDKGKTLFVTCPTTLYAIDLKVRGSQ